MNRYIFITLALMLSVACACAQDCSALINSTKDKTTGFISYDYNPMRFIASLKGDNKIAFYASYNTGTRELNLFSLPLKIGGDTISGGVISFQFDDGSMLICDNDVRKPIVKHTFLITLLSTDGAPADTLRQQLFEKRIKSVALTYGNEQSIYVLRPAQAGRLQVALRCLRRIGR